VFQQNAAKNVEDLLADVCETVDGLASVCVEIFQDPFYAVALHVAHTIGALPLSSASVQRFLAKIVRQNVLRECPTRAQLVCTVRFL
jgi:hypothetical protein